MYQLVSSPVMLSLLLATSHLVSSTVQSSRHILSCLLSSLTCPLVFLSSPLLKSQIQVFSRLVSSPCLIFLSSAHPLSHSLSLHLNFFFSPHIVSPPSFCLVFSALVSSRLQQSKPLYPLHSPLNSPVRLSLSRSACPQPRFLPLMNTWSPLISDPHCISSPAFCSEYSSSSKTGWSCSSSFFLS